MRMTDDPAQQDADRKDRRTQKWLEHCAACHDELLAACKAAAKRIEKLNTGGPDLPDEILEDCQAAIAKAESKP